VRFPSACGKTNLAMLIPRRVTRLEGLDARRGHCVAPSGQGRRLYAINPESATSASFPHQSKTNRNAYDTIRRDTIFTNVP